VLISQLPNQTNGIFAECQCALCGQPQVLADQFVIAADTTPIGTIKLWGGNYPGDSTPVDNWNIEIYQDSAGFPGASVFSYVGPSTTMTQTGIVLFGVHEWLVTFDLADPDPILGAGTYWLAVWADDPGDDWFWEVGNLDSVHGGPGSVYGFTCPPTFPYADSATNFSFELVEGTAGPPPNDCNENGIPDECDIGTEWGGYCVGPDCSSDYNGNGVPDECELCGDFTGATPGSEPDGLVDAFDYWYIHDGMGCCSYSAEPCLSKYTQHILADMDGDGCITFVDYQNWIMCYRMANGKDFVVPKPKLPPKMKPLPMGSSSGSVSPMRP
jgi:hypothetical protein